MRMLDIIAKKRLGGKHTDEEIAFVVKAASDPKVGVPDYQLTSWLMAVCCRGMDETETAALTRAMALSGRRLDLKRLPAPKVDKHSTGGVGDGISLALAPLMAAAGLIVPMMSGRGLGLRLNTPMGPIRLDYGIGDSRAFGEGIVHFSIGQAF